ncbi:putative Agenet-like domain-containing protein [Helianthus annuus]|nr:putative Agenet-like domain-containing protein [Helianthus annuus]KAJ0506240.1 putative Agenet-like domain-containing protein [Helianthus annuus]KAJ0675912.1 putative Agenet-like domain-containing protein [Helianthus annuus]
MEKFEVGQLAEMRSFLKGYRSAWFRCKIRDIDLEKKKILPEYYDYDPAELIWENIYQAPRGGKKSKQVKRHLMVRPQYPMVGDLVDWFADGCYWSVTVVKVLSNDKVQVVLPLPPFGDGKEGEEGKHEAFCSDCRPSLNWSPTKGWTLPTVEGRTSGDAQLLFPTTQGMEPEPAAAGSTACISAEGSGSDMDMESNPEPAAAGSTTCISVEGDRDNKQSEERVSMDCDVGMDLEPNPEPAAAGSTTRVSADGDRDSEQNGKSSESSLSLQKKEAEDKVEKRGLNIMHEDSLEAALIDLEELVTKVNWMQRLLKSSSSDAPPSSWKFA